jgi:CheY-like chemotaxis protein/nitrogen-specific signal transduction histidine kinase
MADREDKDLTKEELLAELTRMREERRFLTDALEGALSRIEKAETANRAKDEFLATLSHELRTPLNAILGWAQMLAKSELDEATWKRAVLTIERNTKLQARLIEELLDVSRIISGKLRIDPKPVNIGPIVAAALDSVRQAASEKNITLDSSIAAVPELLQGDPGRLQQIIGNVLTNAIKFTPKGGRVELSLQHVDRKVRLTVSDSGRGIAPHLLPHIFERFRQGDNARTNGGLGLGLAIARHLVELHGGTISAESDGEGKGAKFIIELPELGPAERRAAQRAVSTLPRQSTIDSLPSLAGANVVVVDDEPDARELIGTILKHFGASVRMAASASEAYDLVVGSPPHVLVSDIAMPAQDGYQLIAKIRGHASEAVNKLFAIAVTAYATRQDRERAIAAGFQRHLAKPVEAPELVNLVSALYREKSSFPETDGAATNTL